MIAHLLRRIASVSSIALVAGLGACAAQTVVPAPTPAVISARAELPQRVVLISIDGFHPDYLNRGYTPVLDQLAAEGTSAAMRPSWPSVTFPNHYTLVTGKHPDHHGIVANRFFDAELGTFSMSKMDTGWWNQAEPIWITAEKAGVRSGTMFWPGSEAEIDGIRPGQWVRFDQSMAGDARVDRVLSWQDLPADQRPQLTTLYFDIVDTAGHFHGPEAQETRDATASVDASIGRLIEGLKARGLYEGTLIIVASDHGMAATSPERVIQIEDIIDPAALRIGYSGANLTADAVPGREAEVQARLVGKHDHMECWNKADVPARLAYGTNDRVAQVVCMVETGWLATTRDRPVTRAGGAHGYDNLAHEMQALFIANGPGVVRGRVLGNMDSVDVQPFIGRMLGIAVPAGDGRPEDTLPITTP